MAELVSSVTAGKSFPKILDCGYVNTILKPKVVWVGIPLHPLSKSLSQRRIVNTLTSTLKFILWRSLSDLQNQVAFGAYLQRILCTLKGSGTKFDDKIASKEALCDVVLQFLHTVSHGLTMPLQFKVCNSESSSLSCPMYVPSEYQYLNLTSMNAYMSYGRVQELFFARNRMEVVIIVIPQAFHSCLMTVKFVSRARKISVIRNTGCVFFMLVNIIPFLSLQKTISRAQKIVKFNIEIGPLNVNDPLPYCLQFASSSRCSTYAIQRSTFRTFQKPSKYLKGNDKIAITAKHLCDFLFFYVQEAKCATLSETSFEEIPEDIFTAFLKTAS